MAEQCAVRTSARVNDQTAEKLKKKHDEAFKFISEAIMLESNERTEQAKALYTRGILKIDEALKMSVENCNPSQKDKLKEMQQKMKRARQEANSRLSALSTDDYVNCPPENPILPSYSEACGISNEGSAHSSASAPSTQHRPPRPQRPAESVSNARDTRAMSYSQLNAVLDNILEDQLESEASAPPDHELVDVAFMTDNVQIYYISPDGNVSAPSYPAPLRVIRGDSSNAGPALLQVGTWTYPLLPGTSPMLQQDSGCYILPDVTSQQPGSAVGLILPSEMVESQKELFNSLMKDLTAMQTSEFAASAPPQETPGEPTKGSNEIHSSNLTSTKISNGLAKGGELLSFGLSKGAEHATKLFRYSSSKIKQRLIPDDKPSKIDPRVQKGLEVARDVTGVAVLASGILVSKMGDAAVSIAKAVAPHVEKYGSEVLAKASGSNKQKSDERVSGIIEVASGGLKGLAAVYIGLETAGKILTSSLSKETVQIIDHKYGSEAACVADSSINSALNLAFAARNITALGPKSLAKQVCKETGKAVIHQDYKGCNDNQIKRTR